MKSLARLVLIAVIAVGCLNAASSASATPICTIEGSSATEQLAGTTGDDVICSGGGDDVITGNGGNDTILITGGGSVNVTLGSGNDTVDGAAAGAITVDAGAGADVITGSTGADNLVGGDGADRIAAGDGADSLEGGAGNDTLNGGEGNDTIRGQVGADVLQGEAGDDLLAGGDGVDALIGGFGLNNCDYTARELRTTTCIYDSAGPKFVIAVSPTVVDSGATNRTYFVTAHVTDPNGIKYLSFNCPGGYTSLDPFDGHTYANVVSQSGNRKDLTITLRGEIALGYAPANVGCVAFGKDDLDNYGSFNPYMYYLSITRKAGAWDIQSPLMTSITVPQVEVGQTQSVSHVVAKVTESTDVTSVSMYCRLKSTAGLTYWLMPGTFTVTHVGNLFTLESDISVPRGQYPGKYLCEISGRDPAMNGLADARKGRREIPLVVKRTGGIWDDAAPSLVVATFSPNYVDVGSSAATTRLTLNATDLTGIKSISVICQQSPPSGEEVWFLRASISSSRDSQNSVVWVPSENTITVTGDEHALTMTADFTIPFGKSPGEMVCTYQLDDGTNRVEYQQGGVLDTFHGHLRAPASVETLRVLRTPPGLPQAPTGLSYVADKPTSGVLSWTAPTFPGDPVLRDYQVSYSTDSKAWKTISDGYSTTTSLPLSNLSPNKDYWFKIRGDNGGNSIAGSPGGTWSQVLKIHTPNATVADAPVTLSVSAIGKQSAKLSWSTGYNGGSVQTDFVARVSPDGGQTWKVITHPKSTAITMSLSGLLAGRAYLVDISIRNAVGVSTRTQVSFTTLP